MFVNLSVCILGLKEKLIFLKPEVKKEISIRPKLVPILRNEMLFFPDKPFCDGLRPASSGQVVNYRCSLPRIELLCRTLASSSKRCQIPPNHLVYVLLSLVARGVK